MGQQQLLLVILVTIIVGIATVVAINIFGTAAEQSNRDAVRQDLLSAGSQAQALYTRPRMMGGLDNFSELTDIRRLHISGTLGTVGEGNDAVTVLENENGTYSFDGGTNSITIHGDPASGGDRISLTVTLNTDTGNWDFSWPTDTN